MFIIIIIIIIIIIVFKTCAMQMHIKHCFTWHRCFSGNHWLSNTEELLMVCCFTCSLCSRPTKNSCQEIPTSPSRDWCWEFTLYINEWRRECAKQRRYVLISYCSSTALL